MHPDSSIADRITGTLLFVLGVSMLVGGYTMDRLEIRQIHPASIPGLVPMALGVAMSLCAVLLILSTRRKLPQDNITTNDTLNTKGADKSGSYRNLGVTALLCVIYAAGLVGRIPFVAATALFIFAYSVYFLWPNQTENNLAKLRIALLCAAYASLFAIAISVLFRYGFLVRLP